MFVFIDIYTILLLLIIVIQDIRHRAIFWFLIPLLFIAFAAKGLLLLPITQLIRNFSINIGFVFFQLVILIIYISVKNKRPVFIINSHLGLGDVLFLVVMCIVFSPVNFIVFYVGSLIFSLIAFISYMLTTRKASENIPLAGMIAILLVALIIVNWVFPEMNFYKDLF